MEPLPETAPDTFKVALEAGDVVLDFGRMREAGQGGRTVDVSDHIVLPLDTARRLVLALEEALRPHAERLRAEEARALPPGEAAIAARPGALAARAAPDPAGEQGALLLRLVGELGVPHQYERSFRVSAGGLHANRFLMTVDKRDLLGDARARVLAICDRLAMPPELRAAAEERFDMASCVHFGFEGDGEAAVCKLYLERAVPQDEAVRVRERAEPVLLHLAFKWDVRGAGAVTTQYLWHPALSAAGIEDRLARNVYRGAQSQSLDLARQVLAIAAARAPAEQLQYLEVEEEGNGRRSFDLNLYNARMQVKDVQSVLYRMRDLHGVRPGQFQALYDQIKAKALGHLAGGVHRGGEDFFNLYYGVAGLPHFHEGFRQAR